MTTTRVGEIGVALIGLQALVAALIALPSRLFSALTIPQAYRMLSHASEEIGIGPTEVALTHVGALLTSILTLAPGVIVLLERRRIAAWLLPASEPVEVSVPADGLIRVGTVLIGIFFVMSGIAAFASMSTTQVRIGSTGEFKSVVGWAGPLVRVGGGLVLCLYSRWFARRLGGGSQRDGGA